MGCGQGRGQSAQSRVELSGRYSGVRRCFALVEHDLSVDYGEDRYVATGLANGVVIVVVYTEREERIRLISARKANGREQRAYHQG